MDTIVGAGQSGVILSMVERKSKLTLLMKMDRRTAEATEAALWKQLLPLREHVLTLTADNAKECTNHQWIGKSLEAGVYFAIPYHS